MKKLIEFGKDQQAGSTFKTASQTDGVFYKEISFPGKKLPIAVCIVFDLGQNANLSSSTSEVLDNAGKILKACISRDSKSLLAELTQRIGFINSNNFLGNSFSYSIAIINGPELHFTTVGECTRVYVVHNGTTERLSVPMLPGDVNQNAKIVNKEFEPGYKSRLLTAGDKVILCSDGLYSIVHDQNEFSIIDRYDNPSFAAKHLNSLAMGRNAADNVTTVVITFRKKSSQIPKTPFLLGGVALAVLLTLILIFSLRKPTTPLPEDLGIAIPVYGQLFQFNAENETKKAIELFSVINPGTFLVTGDLEPVLLKLKIRNVTSNSTENVAGINIYLAKSSEVILANLDYARKINDALSPSELLDQSTFELIKGSVLILNEGNSRDYKVVFNNNEKETQYAFVLSSTPDNSGAIGATRIGNKVELFCISGICQLTSGDNIQNIPILSKAVISLDVKMPESLDLIRIPDNDWIMLSTLSNGTMK